MAKLCAGLALLLVSAHATVAGAQDAARELTAQELLALANEGEVIEVWDTRKGKPFERDTQLRLSGAQLAERGIVDLAGALAQLPELTAREAGRGGVNLDIRGARKGGVRVLIDGFAVVDPFYGTFDVATIPVTDIEQIRVTTTAASPLDGPGGPGGVIEVITRDGVGKQMIAARAALDSLPGGTASGTARVALTSRLGLRMSMTGTLSAREFDVPAASDGSRVQVGEGKRAATFAARLEYRNSQRDDGTSDARLLRHATRRVVLDVAMDDRHYLAPPSETQLGSLLLIDREQAARAVVAWDERVGGWQVAARGFAQSLHRMSRNFRAASPDDATSAERIGSYRAGTSLLATKAVSARARGAASLFVEHERANVAATFAPATGAVTILEPALNGQWQNPTMRVDGTLGAAVPVGLAAAPWLEAKLTGNWQARSWLGATATVARKGRTPSLRERFDTATGNPALGAEIANSAELRVVGETARWRLELAPYVRVSQGASRIDASTGRLVNVGELRVVGFDLMTSVQVLPALRLGGAYTPIQARSDLAGDGDALDRLPTQRGEVWLEAKLPARLFVRGRVRGYNASVDQGQVLPGAMVAEASVNWGMGRGRMLTLRVDDLLDERPLVRTGYRAAGRSATLQANWQW